MNSVAHTLSYTNVFSVDLGLNPQEDDAKFLEFSKIVEDGHSRIGRLPKRFLENLRIPCTRRQFRIAVKHSSGTRNSCELTRNVG